MSQDFGKCSQIITASVQALDGEFCKNISILLKDPLGILYNEEEASHFNFFLWGVAQILHFGIRVMNLFITKGVSSATH